MRLNGGSAMNSMQTSGNGVLVIAEEFMLAELACAANGIANTEPVCAMVFGEPKLVTGFDKVFVVEKLTEYNTDLYTAAALDLIKEIQPSIVLIGATNQGRDLAPRIASALNTGLTADCTDLTLSKHGLLEATRPTFGGQLMAVIICKTKPQMATVRPGVFKPAESDKLPEIIYRDAPYVHPRVELLDFSEQPRKVNELETAEIIVTGGAGIGADGFRLLEEFAAALGAKVGATRGAVHTGLASAAQQIGQTGLTVSPKLYIACGVSGSVQHIVGMCGSKKIVAINIDPDAPIFQNCDVGYVGDIFEVIPQLMEKFCI